MSRVHEVRYAHPTARDLLPTFIEMGQGDRFRAENVYLARQVTLVLSSDEDPTARVPVSAYFPRLYAPDRKSNYAPDPICIALSPIPSREGPAAELLQALATHQTKQPTPCLLLATK